MEKNNKKHDETMKQKLILLILFCLCTLGVAAQGVVTRQKPRQNTTQPATPSKPRQNTQQRQKPRQNTQTRPQNSGTANRRATSATVTRSGDNMVLSVGGVSYTMVYVQGGTFTMGATSEQGREAYDDENPAHSVTLSSYYMGETEVTQALWQAVMGTTVSQQRDKANKEWTLCGEGGNLPMYYISWDECQEFVNRLNSLTCQQFRLPTEAQWEYAARGGAKSRGYKYSGSNDIGSVAWYRDNSSLKTHPVKTKQPNELGLYDMNGNVNEWCQDWYGLYSSGSQTNPTGASSGSDRVCRGDSWSDSAGGCRVSRRNYNTPSGRLSILGLRLAL